MAGHTERKRRHSWYGMVRHLYSYLLSLSLSLSFILVSSCRVVSLFPPSFSYISSSQRRSITLKLFHIFLNSTYSILSYRLLFSSLLSSLLLFSTRFIHSFPLYHPLAIMRVPFLSMMAWPISINSLSSSHIHIHHASYTNIYYSTFPFP